MKIKFGSLVTDGRGKIGGHVASKNRSAAYLRTKVTPVNRRTTFQTAVRALLATISQAWRSLTQAQRDAWNTAVANFATTNIFGDLRNPSGFNLYQKLNNNLAIAGQAFISDPPLAVAVDAPVIDVFGMLGTPTPELSITFASAVPADAVYQIMATAPMSAGKNFVKSEFRQIAIIEAAAGPTISIEEAYDVKFGALPVSGQKVFVEVYAISTVTGQASVGVQASYIMV